MREWRKKSLWKRIRRPKRKRKISGVLHKAERSDSPIPEVCSVLANMAEIQ